MVNNRCPSGLKKPRIIQKNSATPTQIIFGELSNNSPIAVKTYISIPKYNNYTGDLYKYYIQTLSLEYEAEMYKLINKIVKKTYSPNFLTFKGVDVCDFDGVSKLLNVDKYELAKKFYLYKILPIDTLLKLNISMIITERPEVSVSFSKFMENDINITDYKSVIFQIIYSIEVMIRSKIQHNDLHLENILVEVLNKPKNMVFKIGDNEFYYIKTRYIPKIFDWDSSYSPLIGMNQELEEYKCKYFGVCNKLNNRFDLFTFLCRQNYKCSKSPLNEPCSKFTNQVIKWHKRLLDDTTIDLTDFWNLSPDSGGHPCLSRVDISDSVIKSPIDIIRDTFEEFTIENVPSNTSIYQLP